MDIYKGCNGIFKHVLLMQEASHHAFTLEARYEHLTLDRVELLSVVIREGELSKWQCRALQCLCKAFGFPTELRLDTDAGEAAATTLSD
jgi:hypothetical protein